MKLTLPFSDSVPWGAFFSETTGTDVGTIAVFHTIMRRLTKGQTMTKGQTGDQRSDNDRFAVFFVFYLQIKKKYVIIRREG